MIIQKSIVINDLLLCITSQRQKRCICLTILTIILYTLSNIKGYDTLKIISAKPLPKADFYSLNLCEMVIINTR